MPGGTTSTRYSKMSLQKRFKINNNKNFFLTVMELNKSKLYNRVCVLKWNN